MTRKADVVTGDEVEWKWGTGRGEGRITQVHETDVAKTIKGHEITRKASTQKPAVEVKANKGAKVLKSSSEVKVK